jgi:phosphatidylserine/phosphatidylglycerophosphate/cardiolipin synthase-like enzyme
MNNAKHQIDVIQYAIQNPSARAPKIWREIWQIILATPQRGIRCRLIAPTMPDPRGKRPAAQCALKQLRAAGWLVRIAPPAHPCHAKLVLIDHAISITGSHNWTHTAATINREHSIMVNDPTTHAENLTWFGKLWTTSHESV